MESKILILTALKTFALGKAKQGVVLFGEEKFYGSGKRIYDPIFHARENIPNPYEVERPCSLVIPVVDGDYPEVTVLELNAQHPGFTEFAGLEVDRSLFYDALDGVLGTELKFADGYSRILEKPF
jgi:hypothetical protein